MRLWRLCRSRYVSSAFDGEGARIYGGRWNLPGTALVYTSGSHALAALEQLVHFAHEDAPTDIVAIPVDLPDDLPVETVSVARLPKDWKRTPAPAELARLGTKWVQAGRGLILRVPSAVIPDEYNYLINPRHHDVARLVIGNPKPFSFDARLIDPRKRPRKPGSKPRPRRRRK